MNPANPATVYLADSRTGVFKSEDGGAHWTAISAGLPGTAVAALVMDPEDPAVLYAAVYCNGPTARGFVCPGGVFKTTDGGSSWRSANSGIPNTDIVTLAVDPAHASTLYSGNTGGGVFKSTDGGAHWIAAHSGIVALGITDLAVDPADPSIVYAAAYGGGVYKTTDGAGSWTSTSSGITEAVVPALGLGPRSMSMQALSAEVSTEAPTAVRGGPE